MTLHLSLFASWIKISQTDSAQLFAVSRSLNCYTQVISNHHLSSIWQKAANCTDNFLRALRRITYFIKKSEQSKKINIRVHRYSTLREKDSQLSSFSQPSSQLAAQKTRQSLQTMLRMERAWVMPRSRLDWRSSCPHSMTLIIRIQSRSPRRETSSTHKMRCFWGNWASFQRTKAKIPRGTLKSERSRQQTKPMSEMGSRKKRKFSPEPISRSGGCLNITVEWLLRVAVLVPITVLRPIWIWAIIIKYNRSIYTGFKPNHSASQYMAAHWPSPSWRICSAKSTTAPASWSRPRRSTWRSRAPIRQLARSTPARSPASISSSESVKASKVMMQAFEEIKRRSGLSDLTEIANIFLRSEEQNSSLYNYMDSLSHNIDSLEKANAELEAGIAAQDRADGERLQLATSTPEAERRQQELQQYVARKEEAAQELSQLVKAIGPNLADTLMQLAQSPLCDEPGKLAEYELGINVSERMVKDYLPDIKKFIKNLLLLTFHLFGSFGYFVYRQHLIQAAAIFGGILWMIWEILAIFWYYQIFLIIYKAIKILYCRPYSVCRTLTPCDRNLSSYSSFWASSPKSIHFCLLNLLTANIPLKHLQTKSHPSDAAQQPQRYAPVPPQPMQYPYKEPDKYFKKGIDPRWLNLYS